MCCFLCSVLVFNGGYKSYVDAFSLAVIGTVTLGEAILYCAATLGTVWAASEVYEHSDSLEIAGEQMLTDFQEWCLDCSDYINVTTYEIEEWLAQVCEGTLDKGCEVWDAFKDYIVSINVTQGEMVLNNKGVQSVDVSFEDVKSVMKKIDYTSLSKLVVNVPAFFHSDFSASANEEFYLANDGHTVSVSINCTDQSVGVVCTNAYANSPNLIGAYGVGGVSLYLYDGNPYIYCRDIMYNSCVLDNCPSFGGSYCGNSGKVFADAQYQINIDCSSGQLYYLFPQNTKRLVELIIASGVVNGYWDFSIPVPDWGIADDVVIDKNVQDVIERDGNLDNVDVWGYNDLTLDKDGVISIPWENVHPKDLVEPYVGGQTIAIDVVDGVVVGTDTPVEDVPEEQVVLRDSYTIPKLETVFPFCIPFDLVNIFRIFKADAKAPCFTWTFTFWLGEFKTYDLDIDLSPFDTVAEILRTMELILFLVGLTIKTRDLIRG